MSFSRNFAYFYRFIVIVCCVGRTGQFFGEWSSVSMRRIYVGCIILAGGGAFWMLSESSLKTYLSLGFRVLAAKMKD